MFNPSSTNSTTERRRAHFKNNLIDELYEDEQNEKDYYRGESINCKLQALNILHAILGAVGLGLAGTQFQTKIGIDNYRQIDLRMASALLYTITGTIGFYCVNRSHGSIVIKCLYCLTALFALGTAIFYGFTTYKVRRENNWYFSVIRPQTESQPTLTGYNFLMPDLQINFISFESPR
ncbi:unnamed protein product [Meloidogyne enterolobii]|uniref:Uncharacterized protein n=1 Tax=Meloidogyne enterolobii TaxID=390850 RepID=A0ACB0Z0Q1_MELEN